jgi:hypothetical protein
MSHDERLELAEAEFDGSRALWTATVGEMEAELGEHRSTRLSRRLHSRVADAKTAFGIFGRHVGKRNYFRYYASDMWDLFLLDLDAYEERLNFLKRELNSLWFDFVIATPDTDNLESLEDWVEFELLILKQFRAHWGRKLYHWN